MKWVPHRKRVSGPKLSAAYAPTKCSRGTDDSKPSQHKMTDVTIAPGQYFTLGNATQDLVPAYVDYGYSASLGDFYNTDGGKLALKCGSTEIDSAKVVLAVGYFQRRFGRRLLLVWDRLNAHRSKQVQRFLAAHAPDVAVAYLPAYAPELNPEEQCNAWVKRAMTNALPGSVDDLAAHARRSFRQLQRHPAMITHFFHHAGLRC